tara:strand:+ start:242 stop:574 length:333 start_codon:yes stop_codon:yes gene_type:complete
MSRYDTRESVFNEDKLYKKLLKERGNKRIEQYSTPTHYSPDPELIASIETITYRWRKNDTFWKISSRFYGDPKHWWVIAGFNRAPTEAHLKVGNIIRIPTSLAKAFEVLK